MSLSSSLLLTLTLCLSPLTAQDDGAPTDPVATVRAAAEATRARDLGALWALLPPSYQEDVTRLVRRYTRGVAPEVHARSFELLDAFATQLRARRELLLRSSPAADSGLPTQELELRLETFTRLVETAASCELSDHAVFLEPDIGRFLAGDGARLLQGTMELVPNGMTELWQFAAAMTSFTDAHIETREATTRRATLHIDSPYVGVFGGDPFVLVEIEGRWIPEPVAAVWNLAIASAELDLADRDLRAERDVARRELSELEALVDRFAQANTPEELDAAFGSRGRGMLATIFTGPNAILRRQLEAQVAGTRVMMVNLRGALSSYRRHHKHVPMSLDDLTRPNVKNFDEPYVVGIEDLHDAWGNPFVYTRHDTRSYTLTSYGADGVPGGEGFDADISEP